MATKTVTREFYILEDVKYDFAISNVQCQYEDSPSDTEGEERAPGGEERAPGGEGRPAEDHTYGARDEPPAFIIPTVPIKTITQFDPRAKIMTLAPGFSTVNVIHVGDQPPNMLCPTTPQTEYNMNKRIRRSEVVLRQAADCVSRGSTFQTVSEQFNIPISTIRFFMARKGILPRRRRGRNTQPRTSPSPEPPFSLQNYKLPPAVGLRDDDEESHV